jgi:nucleoside-diphosphate-sugar epimerase
VQGTSRALRESPAEGLRWWQCELTDTAAVRVCFERSRPDYVVHLSSLADGRPDRALVIPTLRAETLAAVNILDAATSTGVRRLLMPASLEEPGPGEAPASPYAAAKAASHLYAKLFHRLYQTPVVMARIFMAYGPGQPEWKLIPATVRRMLRGERVVIESPERRVDWIYISDVVAGLVATLCAPGLEGDLVELGSGKLTSVREIVDRLQKLTQPALAPVYDGARPRGNECTRAADVEKSRRQTGWAPQVSLDEGLARTVAALRQREMEAPDGLLM